MVTPRRDAVSRSIDDVRPAGRVDLLIAVDVLELGHALQHLASSFGSPLRCSSSQVVVLERVLVLALRLTRPPIVRSCTGCRQQR